MFERRDNDTLVALRVCFETGFLPGLFNAYWLAKFTQAAREIGQFCRYETKISSKDSWEEPVTL